MHRASTPFSPQSKEIEFDDFSPTEYEIEKLNFKSNDIVWLGDMHGNFILTLKLLRTIGVIEFTESDHDEYVKIADNLELLQPFSQVVLQILNFAKRAKENFNDLTISDYLGALDAIKSIDEKVSYLSGYSDEDYKNFDNLADRLQWYGDESDGLCKYIHQEKLESVTQELMRLCQKGISTLKSVISSDYITFQNLLSRIKKGANEEGEIKIGFLGDRTADRRGCDLHILRLQEIFVKLGLKIVAETISNHGLELDYNIKYNPDLKQRLHNLLNEDELINFFANPLTSDDYVSLFPGDFSASLLNLFRGVAWGLESYDEVIKLYKQYYEPYLIIALAVRDKLKNDSSTLVTHAPPALANDSDEILRELLAFFNVKCKDYSNASEREEAVKVVNKAFHAWRQTVSPKEYKAVFGDLGHPLHKVLWNRISSDDIVKAAEIYSAGEVRKNSHLFGHDSNVRELPVECRSWLSCGDGSAGKGAVGDKGKAYVCSTRFNATPGNTPYKENEVGKETTVKIAGARASVPVSSIGRINIKSEKSKRSTRRMSGIHPVMASKEDTDQAESLAGSMLKSPYRAPRQSFFNDNEVKTNKEISQEAKIKIMSSVL